MYAAGSAIRPTRSHRPAAAGRLAVRAVLVAGFVLIVGLVLALIAHGGSPAPDSTVVVQPGDTLWSIAATHYPSDDVRVRVDDIEQANRLHSPVIEVGQTLRLPG
jgi:nucleoid-associated protein YgaU